jgi:hypothetical protein
MSEEKKAIRKPRVTKKTEPKVDIKAETMKILNNMKSYAIALRRVPHAMAMTSMKKQMKEISKLEKLLNLK